MIGYYLFFEKITRSKKPEILSMGLLLKLNIIPTTLIMTKKLILLVTRAALLCQCFLAVGCFLNAKMSRLDRATSSLGIDLPSHVSVNEGSELDIDVSLLRYSEQLSKVYFETVNGSALAGVNFTAVSSSLDFSESQKKQVIKIKTSDVGMGYEAKDFAVRLYNADRENLGEVAVTINSSNKLTKVEDLSPIKSTSFKYAELGSVILYSGYDEEGGYELWRSDNSVSGTFRVKDICPGRCSSQPTDIVVVSGLAYFVARESDGGKLVIYKSDGTAGGTSKLFDFSQISIMTGFENDEFLAPIAFCDGTSSCLGSRYLFASSTRVFFFLINGGVLTADKYTWYSTQGTVASTRHLSAVDDYSRGSIIFNDRLFVTQEDEIFHWDGSIDNGWVRVNGSSGSLCGGVNDGTFVINGKLYFVCYDVSLSGPRIFKMLSDFTYTGSNVVTSLSTFLTSGRGYDYYYFADFDGANYDIYRSDGTAGGTVKLLDGSGTEYIFLGNVNNKTIFSSGTNIYQSNGTLAGTSIIYSGTSKVATAIGTVSGLFFFHSSGRLFKTDGTGAGTSAVVSADGDEFTWVSSLGSIDNELFFSGKTAARGIELWKITSSGNLLLISEKRSGTLNSHPMQVYKFLGNYFVSMVDDVGSALYKIDGALNIAISEIKYWAEPALNDQLGTIIQSDGKLFWAQSSSQYTSELRSYSSNDGVSTYIGISNYYENSLSANMTILGKAGNSLLLNGYVTIFDNRFGLSFDTQTHTLSTLISVVPRQVMPLNNTLSILVAKNSTSLANTNWEPYVSDGSPAGTSLLVDIVAGASGSNPILLGVINSKVIFHTSQGFYETDGTTPGTVFLVQPSLTIAPTEPIEINNKILFLAGTAATGKELWVTDGTAGNTQLLKDTNSTATGSVVKMLGKNGSSTRVYFVANDGTSGQELWMSDGTLAGTVQVKDMCPGACDTQIDDMLEFQGKNYFWTKVSNLATYTASHLWVTDGTSAGTNLVKSFLPQLKTGAMNANSSTLFFTLTDSLVGNRRQLWFYKPSASTEFRQYPITFGISPMILGVHFDELLLLDRASEVSKQTLYFVK